MSSDELRRRARELGVATGFVDAAGRRRRVSDATLEAVLGAMGADPARPPDPRPPVVVVRQGPSRRRPPRPLGELLGGEHVSVALESGEERPAPRRLPGDLPLGYHRVEGGGWSVPLVVAPPHCQLPGWLERGGRAWGFAAQLYRLHSRASWGFGDLGDLAQLAAPPVAGALGAAFVLVNPLHAAAPAQPSPYFPSSRLFRNPLYLRVEDVPELAGLDREGRARVAELAALGRRPPRRGSLPRLAAVAAGGAARGGAAASRRRGRRPGGRGRPGRLRRLGLPGRAGRGRHRRRAAGPARPARPGLGPAAVRARAARRRRLPAVRPHRPRGDGARPGAAHRPRHGAVPPLLGPRGAPADRGHLRALPGRRPARRGRAGERQGGRAGDRRGPRHGGAGGARAPGRRADPLLPAGMVRAWS